MKKGWLALIGILIIPIVLWMITEPLAGRFVTPQRAFQSIGQITALLGFCLFSVNFMLSTRLKVFEDLFGGLDKVYKAHHLIGGLAFILLLLHPVSLTIQGLTISLRRAFELVVPGYDLAVSMGIFSMLVLIVLLSITFFVKIRYDRWYFSHRLLPIAFVLAMVHIFLISSDISANAWLRFFILLIGLLGLASIIYRSIFPGLLVKRHSCRIDSIRQIGDITEISLSPEDGIIAHKPGQFIFVRFPALGKEFHPFTISSGRSLRISARRMGDYTLLLDRLKKDDIAVVEGPYGSFTAKQDNQVWIAGGIGITPFLAMSDKKGCKATLYYSVRKKEDAAYLDELSGNAGIDLRLHVTAEHGRLTAKAIDDQVSLKGKDIFICGPLPMMESLRDQCIDLGVEKKRIHMEEFSLY